VIVLRNGFTRFTIRTLTVSLAVFTGGVIPAHAASASTATDPAAACTTLKPTSSRLISTAGTTVGADAAATTRAQAATQLTYALPGGVTMSTIVPPAGFLPQNATPATDRAFGFDAPDNPTQLAAWRAKYKGYHTTIPSVPCVGAAGSPHYVDYSPAWGGFVATGHSNYDEVYDDENIPTYSTTCGSDTDAVEAAWIGFGGGVGSTKLIQQGFVSGSSSTATQGAHLWYEYLNSAHDNPPVYIGSSTRTGDVISEYTTYSGGTAGFHWYDRTTSTGWTPVTIGGLSSYYDGTTADVIMEAPVAWPYLRKYSTQTFSAAGAEYGSTFADLFNLPTTEYRLTDTGTSSGAQMASSTKESSSSFNSNWIRCD
jgi:hypothetical protein